MSRAAVRAGALCFTIEAFDRPRAEVRCGVEVGVWKGAMSAELLRLFPNLTLHMVDSWAAPEEQPAEYLDTDDFHATMSEAEQLACMAEAERVTAFAADRRLVHRVPSVHAASNALSGLLDFVFLDGDHSYEGVREDIAAWLPKVRSGGTLGGHDYHPEKNARKNFGVCRAVDEAVAEHGWTLVLSPDDTWFVRVL